MAAAGRETKKKKPAAPAATPENPAGQVTTRFRDLEPSLQLRIRRTLIACGVWFGFVLASAGLFVLAKPYMDRRREERVRRGERPRATHNPSHPYAQRRQYISRTLGNPTNDSDRGSQSCSSQIMVTSTYQLKYILSSFTRIKKLKRYKE